MNTPFSLQNTFDIHQELFSDRNEGTGVFRNSALGVYWFLDANVNKVDISIVGTNGKYFLINAHGVLRRMGAVTEIPGML